MLGLLIVGIILVILGYYLPSMGAPPPLRTICLIVGWICIAIALVLLIAGLLGIAVGVGSLR